MPSACRLSQTLGRYAHTRILIRSSLLFSCLIFPRPAVAQDEYRREQEYFEHGIQMAEVDWDVAHTALIAACTAKYPDKSPELGQSIAAWRATNYSAQVELQRLILAKYPVPADEEAMRKQFTEMTGSIARAYGNLPSENLQDFCNGGYAKITLRLPEMDFRSLLQNLQKNGFFK
jgi:hypothetical protein